MRQKSGVLYVLISYIMWGFFPLFWKQLEDVDSFYVLANRIIWSLLLSAVIVLLLRKDKSAVRKVFADRREFATLTLAGIFVCANWGGYLWAMNHGHMLDGSLAYYFSPMINVLIGTVFFRERLTKLQWLAVVVSFSGLVITAVSYGQVPWLALIIGATFSIYGAIKKLVHTDSLTSMFFESLVLAPFALVFIVYCECQRIGGAGVLQGARWLLLPAAGIVTMVPLMAYAKGVRSTPLTLAGVLMYFNPTLQFLLSVWLYGEEFTQTHTILFGTVWTGLVVYLIAGFVNSRKKEEHPCA